MKTLPPSSVHTSLHETRNPRVGILGATLGTGNLGVDALGISLVQGLSEAIPNVEIVYQSWDTRRQVSIPYRGQTVECDSVAIHPKGSLLDQDGILQIKRLGRLRKWMPKGTNARPLKYLPLFSEALKQLLSCDAILDVSAGDSFADTYGQDVFWYQSQLKLLCLELGLPLVLMPQTYGPFLNDSTIQIAASILSRARLVCTREAEGIEEIQQICVARSPRRLLKVPDMAFLLEPRETILPEGVAKDRSSETTLIALNISGLLFNARKSFGLRANYHVLARRLLLWALSLPHSRVLLVPHVVSPARYGVQQLPRATTRDSTDMAASEELLSELSPVEASRVDVLRGANDPARAKYAISCCDFFVGARMHAFIGAISQAVPGTLLAYSKKADGLASLLGISDSVIDLRTQTIDNCLAMVDSHYNRRAATHEHLAARIPATIAELRRFFAEEIGPLITKESIAFNSLNHNSASANSSSQKLEVPT